MSAYIDIDYLLARADEKDVKSILEVEGVFSESKLNQILNDASKLVDGKLNSRYNIPIIPVGDDLKRIVLDIALYYIYGIAHTNEEMESLYNRYKIAIKELDKIVSGVRNLIGVPNKANNTGTMLVSNTRPKVFTEEYLGSW